ncbi:hypothetical protein TEA_022222 [Camellia sinensis var. sinensis]|uniref:Uncharacterized protein n=1 Tax=Camellia sinensis var. sinensis TaxID=542762 RepID=A0A4S4DSP7_CAMSN|nr:hypothetical protein TEA_022222 [Camellia sinensis var. sinensis]
MASTFYSNFHYFDNLIVVRIFVYTTIVCEAISWVLIYRTTSYKSIKFSIDKASKKLKTMKTDSNPSKLNLKKSKTKKIHRVESNHDLSLFKFKSSTVVALALFGLLNSLFKGKAVVKLPFVPARIVQKMSHRGLQGDDLTDYSMDPQVVTGSHDTTIKFWDLRFGKTMTTLTHHKKSVRAMALHPKENCFASASADNIKKFNLPKGEFMHNML